MKHWCVDVLDNLAKSIQIVCDGENLAYLAPGFPHLVSAQC